MLHDTKDKTGKRKVRMISKMKKGKTHKIYVGVTPGHLRTPFQGGISIHTPQGSQSGVMLTTTESSQVEPLVYPQSTRIPTEEEFQHTLSGLGKNDLKQVAQIRKLVVQQLGSDDAARVWFTTAGGAFAATPLELIRAGKADMVLAYLKSQAEPGAAYA